MKSLNFWNCILLYAVTLSIIVSCSSDSDSDSDSSDDTGMPFTYDLIKGSWKIVSSASSMSDFSTEKTAMFVDNGACLGFHTMETKYELREGKIHTSYGKNQEPMFIYTLQSVNKTDKDTTLNIRVDGTLDDNSSFDIIVKKFDEFPDWKNKNEQEFLSLYQEGKKLRDAGQNWAVINSYTGARFSPTDYIVMQILDAGTGISKPSYTDIVTVNYRERLLPSVSYPQGLVVDETFTGSYNSSVHAPLKGKVSSFIGGFATALMQMNRGSHCVIYIPYQLAYGSIRIGFIPAYSMLICEIWLEDF